VVSLDAVAPSRMVSVSASVNLPLHHKVQKFSSGTGSPAWSQKKGHKMIVVVVVIVLNLSFIGRFFGESESAGIRRFSSHTCRGREPLGISGTDFYAPAALPVTRPTVSKHWWKHEALTPASDLASSFLYPPPASCGKGRWSIFANILCN